MVMFHILRISIYFLYTLLHFYMKLISCSINCVVYKVTLGMDWVFSFNSSNIGKSSRTG